MQWPILSLPAFSPAEAIGAVSIKAAAAAAREAADSVCLSNFMIGDSFETGLGCRSATRRTGMA